ncbi:MAG: ribonuclease E activity regulator RraA [bacterium]|nr:ribonuclease E activity regulator RraA [bacterium]
MDKKTTDICDIHADKIEIAHSIEFKDYGGKKIFSGQIVTVKCFETNPLVRKALEQDGCGKVLVVDGGASIRCALLGDNIGELAVKNKWNGIIVNGCIRDSAALLQLDIGIKALGTNPLKSFKRNEGEDNISLYFAGVNFVPNGYVYCDEDGIVTSKEKL